MRGLRRLESLGRPADRISPLPSAVADAAVTLAGERPNVAPEMLAAEVVAERYEKSWRSTPADAYKEALHAIQVVRGIVAPTGLEMLKALGSADYPVGHVSTRTDGSQWKKTAPDKWVRVRGPGGTKPTGHSEVTARRPRAAEPTDSAKRPAKADSPPLRETPQYSHDRHQGDHRQEPGRSPRQPHDYSPIDHEMTAAHFRRVQRWGGHLANVESGEFDPASGTRRYTVRKVHDRGGEPVSVKGNKHLLGAKVRGDGANRVVEHSGGEDGAHLGPAEHHYVRVPHEEQHHHERVAVKDHKRWAKDPADKALSGLDLVKGLLLKAMGLPVGHVSSYTDGSKWKKIAPDKWRQVAGTPAPEPPAHHVLEHAGLAEREKLATAQRQRGGIQAIKPADTVQSGLFDAPHLPSMGEGTGQRMQFDMFADKMPTKPQADLFAAPKPAEASTSRADTLRDTMSDQQIHELHQALDRAGSRGQKVDAGQASDVAAERNRRIEAHRKPLEALSHSVLDNRLGLERQHQQGEHLKSPLYHDATAKELNRRGFANPQELYEAAVKERVAAAPKLVNEHREHLRSTVQRVAAEIRASKLPKLTQDALIDGHPDDKMIDSPYRTSEDFKDMARDVEAEFRAEVRDHERTGEAAGVRQNVAIHEVRRHYEQAAERAATEFGRGGPAHIRAAEAANLASALVVHEPAERERMIREHVTKADWSKNITQQNAAYEAEDRLRRAIGEPAHAAHGREIARRLKRELDDQGSSGRTTIRPEVVVTPKDNQPGSTGAHVHQAGYSRKDNPGTTRHRVGLVSGMDIDALGQKIAKEAFSREAGRLGARDAEMARLREEARGPRAGTEEHELAMARARKGGLSGLDLLKSSTAALKKACDKCDDKDATELAKASDKPCEKCGCAGGKAKAGCKCDCHDAPKGE